MIDFANWVWLELATEPWGAQSIITTLAGQTTEGTRVVEQNSKKTSWFTS